jgi:nicotinamidase-related amidase
MVDPVEALVVVDVQNAFVCGDHPLPSADTMLGAVETLVKAARHAGALIVHLQNDGPAGADDEPGTDGWQLYLTPDPGEDVIRKTGDDGFERTELDAILRARGVHGITICGLLSEMCVAATARTALARGFRVVLPHDGHATYDIPAAAHIHADPVRAATASRVAEWSLGDHVEIVARASEVRFS